MTSVATRPKLCPCARTCTPIWNAMAVDSRIKDAEADMSQGYSGECIGKMQEGLELIVGGQVHRNDVNHCFFTPLKGIIRFQENAEDLGSAIWLLQRALDVLRPLQCAHCGEDSRIHEHFVWLVDPGVYRPEMSAEEFNAAPRKLYCHSCAANLGLVKPIPENFRKPGVAKYMQR